MKSEPYEKQVDAAWHHFQQFQKLDTFSEKLQYWTEHIGHYPLAPQVIIIDPTVFKGGPNGSFRFELTPKTVDDRRLLYRATLDFHRIECAEKGFVKLFDGRKAGLEIRLSTATRPVDLLRAELKKITHDIDSGIAGPTAEIGELRYHWETNHPYDFAFLNEYQPHVKVCNLAEDWDIVEYEAHLKDWLVAYETGKHLQIPLPTRQITGPLEPPALAASDENSGKRDQHINTDGQVQLSLRQIAYKYRYEGKVINELKKEEIARNAGFTGKKSGNKLLDHYKGLETSEQRTSCGRDAVKDILKVIPTLTGSAKDTAEVDLKAAKIKKL
ncbi:hypothetical protein GCM10023187_12290 [Nibrella viscosa]|uniref:Uncharacterized protein n=2 Tax=Nibrella viscosa TaxID=1084524 RepID=A0ABP8K3U5_9BACT